MVEDIKIEDKINYKRERESGVIIDRNKIK
jgi:hypothetical protein